MYFVSDISYTMQKKLRKFPTQTLNLKIEAFWQLRNNNNKNNRRCFSTFTKRNKAGKQCISVFFVAADLIHKEYTVRCTCKQFCYHLFAFFVFSLIHTLCTFFYLYWHKCRLSARIELHILFTFYLNDICIAILWHLIVISEKSTCNGNLNKCHRHCTYR